MSNPIPLKREVRDTKIKTTFNVSKQVELAESDEQADIKMIVDSMKRQQPVTPNLLVQNFKTTKPTKN